MSRNNRRKSVSTTTQTETAFKPPATEPAPEVSVETKPIETNGEVTTEPVDEEIELELEETPFVSSLAGAEAKSKRKARTGPRKVSADERDILVAVASLHTENDPWDAKVEFGLLPEEIRTMLLPSSKPTVFARGLLLVEADESGAIQFVTLTETGFEFSGPDLPSRSVTARKAARVAAAREKTPGVPRGLQSELTAKIDKPNVKLVKLTKDNPRQANSHGFYGWQLYVDGMTYREYLKADYDKNQVVGSGALHYGPIPGQVKWDAEHGFIAFYDSDKPEKLEDGTDNPEYWVVRYGLKERKASETTETNGGEKPAEEMPETPAETPAETPPVVPAETPSQPAA